MQNVKMIYQEKSPVVSEALGISKERGDEIIGFADHVVESQTSIAGSLNTIKDFVRDHKELRFGCYVVGAASSRKRTIDSATELTTIAIKAAYDLYRSETKRTLKAERNNLYSIFVGFASMATAVVVNVDIAVWVYVGLAWLPMILQALWWMLRMIGKAIVFVIAVIYAPFYLVYLLIKRYMRNKRTAEEKA